MRITLRLLVTFAVLLPVVAPAQAQEFVWAGQLGGTQEIRAEGVAVDGSGNVYTVGWFNGTIDFDPGPGTYNLTSSHDAFVSVLDRTGRFVRASQFGGTLGASGRDVAVDARSYVYTVGWFDGTVDFDPGPGIYNLTAGTSGDGFVSVLDSAGSFVWAKQFSGDDRVRTLGVALDSEGRVYTVGFFRGSADFDPGPGTSSLDSANTIDDVFVSVLDNNGDFVWAAQFGGGYDAEGSDVTLDADSNVYIAGNFAGTVDFDPGPGTFNLTSASEKDAFVSVLDSTGHLVWVRHLSANLSFGRSVALDDQGRVYIAGRFYGMLDADPGPGTYNMTSAGSYDAYVSVLDSAGDFVWAGRWGGTESDSVAAVAVDASGHVYIVGGFNSTADFDPGPGTFNLTSAGSSDGYVSVLDSALNFVWAGRSGGSESGGGGSGVAVDASGNSYTVGSFNGTVDFDPGPGTFNLTSAGSSDAFVSALRLCGYFVDNAPYGTLLFPPLCTSDASTLPENVYDSIITGISKGPNEAFYVSSDGTSFAPLAVDDAVHCAGQDSGLGPYNYQPGVPPFIYNAPLDYNFVPLPAHDITTSIPAGSGRVLFELLDSDRNIYGNTAVYLVRDCGIWMDENARGRSRLNWVSHDVEVGGFQSNLEVVSGMISELWSDGDFSRACHLGSFVDTMQASDHRPDPSPGDGYYYLMSGTCANPIGYGNSSVGPRQGLPPGHVCP